MSPYPTARQKARKMSISLPADLAAYLERRAREHGTAISTELADLVARERAADEQARLDQALALDAEENRRLAGLATHAVRDVFEEAEW